MVFGIYLNPFTGVVVKLKKFIVTVAMSAAAVSALASTPAFADGEDGSCGAKCFGRESSITDQSPITFGDPLVIGQ